MKEVKSFLPTRLSVEGTTMSISPMKAWRGTLALSMKPRSLKFLSSRILLPASRMGLMGTSWGP